MVSQRPQPRTASRRGRPATVQTRPRRRSGCQEGRILKLTDCTSTSSTGNGSARTGASLATALDGQHRSRRSFCSGVPGSIAVGRRKGPTGKDSLCGTCGASLVFALVRTARAHALLFASPAGKYFHRYKRQRPCVYTRELETHMRYKAEEEAKNPKLKRSKARNPAAAHDLLDPLASARTSGQATPASQALSPISSAHDDEDSDDEESSVSRLGKRRRPAHYGSPDTPFVHFDTDNSDEESVEAVSPPATRLRRDLSVAASPPPSARGTPSAPPTAHTVPPAAPQAPPPVSWLTRGTALGGVPTWPVPMFPARASSMVCLTDVLSPPQQPPDWLIKAAADLRARQVDDRFDIIPRPRAAGPSIQDWRIRCLDCPGKVRQLVASRRTRQRKVKSCPTSRSSTTSGQARRSTASPSTSRTATTAQM